LAAHCPQTIRSQNYKHRYEMVADMQLMVNNCYLYNRGRNDFLLPMVDTVFFDFLERLQTVRLACVL
jgi:hypothetical protein